mgnify:CR=1 FL=1
MRYIRPKSLTWWAGFAAIIIGAVSMAGEDVALLENLSELASILTQGGASPAQLIVTGMGLIGLRDKLERITG